MLDWGRRPVAAPRSGDGRGVVMTAGTGDAVVEARPAGLSSFARFRASLTARDRRSLAGMAAVVVLLHVVGFGVLFVFVVPEPLPPRRRPPGLHRRRRHAGLHLRAAARLRRRPHRRGGQHHPQADGRQRRAARPTARRRERDPQAALGRVLVQPRPLEHRLRAVGAAGLRRPRRWPARSSNGNSGLHDVTGVIGASVSGVFLWILGILNFVALLGILQGVPRPAARPLRRGRRWRSTSTSAAS